MRRPLRTRRLSYAATMSLLAFMAVAVAGIRSVRSYDIWGSGTWVIGLENGSVKFLRETGYYANGPMSSLGHISGSATARRPLINFRFSINSHDVIPNRPGAVRLLEVQIPLWLPLLLLLIAPVCWLIASPANAPAFAVITDARHG